ncbi:hypothetical protein [Granulibacter bethesdensis]|uniref:hypothetical protein n=1 Tax=Granulibacter bethesdensis TaxID=364410 RepID=UPI000F7B3F33|nr:hypothetical protein [Granulibacter bethesdensis]
MMVSGEVAKSYRDKADRDVQAASEKLENDRRNGADSSTLAADADGFKRAQQVSEFGAGYDYFISVSLQACIWLYADYPEQIAR